MIWGDGEAGETDATNLHAAFRLNGVSGIVVLAREHLSETVVLDYVNYAQVGADASYGTYPEGERHSRQIFPTPTPGAANSQSSPLIPVVINEWMPDNESTVLDLTDTRFDDWFELYNDGSNDVELGGHFLTDDLTQTNKFAIPGGTIIEALGYLQVWADNDTEFNAPGAELHVNFGLNNDGEKIGLYAPNGTLVDAVVFGPLAIDQSEGSWPDGSSVIYPMLPPTPATTNLVYVVFEIDVSGMSNNIYRLEANDNLLGTNWFLIDIITADTDVIIFSDPNAIAFPGRFYRLISQTP